MRALVLRIYGEPLTVLNLEETAVPTPTAERIRVRVHACALNPADWAVCNGFVPGPPPRGIGFDVSGTVDAVGTGVHDVAVGDRVFGVPDYMGYPTAGAAEFSVLRIWKAVPPSLGMNEAAALPMAVETAVRSLDQLGVALGQTIFVDGAGSMTGFAAAQIALLRGAHVIASAGETFAGRLRALGAKVTPYGDGMPARVRELADGAPDWVLLTVPHTAQGPNVLHDLIGIVGGDPRRVMAISNFDTEALGIRTTGREPGVVPRYDALDAYARLAAEGRFSIPIARTFRLEDWRAAAELSISAKPHGKLLLLP